MCNLAFLFPRRATAGATLKRTCFRKKQRCKPRRHERERCATCPACREVALEGMGFFEIDNSTQAIVIGIRSRCSSSIRSELICPPY